MAQHTGPSTQPLGSHQKRPELCRPPQEIEECVSFKKSGPDTDKVRGVVAMVADSLSPGGHTSFHVLPGQLASHLG